MQRLETKKPGKTGLYVFRCYVLKRPETASKAFEENLRTTLIVVHIAFPRRQIVDRSKLEAALDEPVFRARGQHEEPLDTAALGKPGVNYDYSNPSIGLEVVDKSATSFTGSTLTLAWNASDPGDHVRILTAVPEPQTYALMLAGLGMTLAAAAS